MNSGWFPLFLKTHTHTYISDTAKVIYNKLLGFYLLTTALNFSQINLSKNKLRNRVKALQKCVNCLDTKSFYEIKLCSFLKLVIQVTEKK